jgi:cysteine-rich repeat protein
VGNSALEANRCRLDCTLPRCGDRVVDRGEVCDDGNLLLGDGCTSTCVWESIDAIQPRCGDGRTQSGEQCDDGNLIGGDGCSAVCQVEFVLGSLEELNPVLVAGGIVCGDGVLLAPEECDDGNPDPGDGCSPLCRNELPVCGNGKLEAGEQCDDGNPFDIDGCNALCQVVALPKPAAPPPLIAQVIPFPMPPSYSYVPVRAPIGDTGPAAIAIMASGAAAGVGWMRRRKKKAA